MGPLLSAAYSERSLSWTQLGFSHGRTSHGRRRVGQEGEDHLNYYLFCAVRAGIFVTFHIFQIFLLHSTSLEEDVQKFRRRISSKYMSFIVTLYCSWDATMYQVFVTPLPCVISPLSLTLLLLNTTLVLPRPDSSRQGVFSWRLVFFKYFSCMLLLRRIFWDLYELHSNLILFLRYDYALSFRHPPPPVCNYTPLINTASPEHNAGLSPLLIVFNTRRIWLIFSHNIPEKYISRIDMSFICCPPPNV